MATDEPRKKRKVESETKDDDVDDEVYDSDDSDTNYEDVNPLFFPGNFDATLPTTIQDVHATRINDSRSYATVEARVRLDNGIWATASLPSGAPSGIYHYLEHRVTYLKFANMEVDYVNKVIGPALIGKDPTQQADIDKLMIEMQERHGTANERALRGRKLGLNAIMAVSVAVCKAGAYVKHVPLARHIADLADTGTLVLPVPSCKLLNGGSRYSDTNLAFQELLITPVGARAFYEAVIINTSAYDHMEKDVIKKYGMDPFLADECDRILMSEEGFTPNIQDVKEGLELVKDAVLSHSKLRGKVVVGMDVAASEFYDSDNMVYDLKFKHENNDGSGKISGTAFKDFYRTLLNEYPIASISEPFHQDDWDNYSKLTSEIGTQVKVVMEAEHLLGIGDSERIKKAIKDKTCNALLLKVNQRATITDCIETVKTCRGAGWTVVMASDCRFGRLTERLNLPRDAFIADLCVGLAVDEIRMGSPYNELTEQFTKIEAWFEKEAVLAGARQTLVLGPRQGLVSSKPRRPVLTQRRLGPSAWAKTGLRLR